MLGHLRKLVRSTQAESPAVTPKPYQQDQGGDTSKQQEGLNTPDSPAPSHTSLGGRHSRRFSAIESASFEAQLRLMQDSLHAVERSVLDNAALQAAESASQSIST